jgi:hypothetical protein
MGIWHGHTPARMNARPNRAGRIAVAMFPSGRDERWVSGFAERKHMPDGNLGRVVNVVNVQIVHDAVELASDDEGHRYTFVGTSRFATTVILNSLISL